VSEGGRWLARRPASASDGRERSAHLEMVQHDLLTGVYRAALHLDAPRKANRLNPHEQDIVLSQLNFTSTTSAEHDDHLRRAIQTE